MAQETDPYDPSQLSEAYRIMQSRWHKMNCVLGGTETMRQAGEKFLPKHEEEVDSDYYNRLQNAVLFNKTEETLVKLVSKPFGQAPLIADDTPPDIQKLFSNIDLCGNDISSVCKAWLNKSLAKAFSFLMVDHPPVPPGHLTKADDKKAKLRPYWILIDPENVLGGVVKINDGVLSFTLLRILESYEKTTGFSTVTAQRIRVLEPGKSTLYYPKESNGEVKWVPEPPVLTSLNFIPVVPFYTSKDADFLGKPRLQDLADLNILHWQMCSNQDHIVTVASFPMLGLSGGTDNEANKIVIGPKQLLWSRDPAAKFYYVEHSGTATGVAREHILDIESRMEMYGSEFLKDRPDRQTATSAKLDSNESNSELAHIVTEFELAVRQALAFTAAWMKVGKVGDDYYGGSLQFNKSWAAESVSQADDTILDAARARGDIDLGSYLGLLQSRGKLPVKFDVKACLDAVEKERQEKVKLKMEEARAWNGGDGIPNEDTSKTTATPARPPK